MYKDKTLCLYLATSIVAFLFAGTYLYIEECYYDESFKQKPFIEQQLFIKYCANPLSFNPFDNYISKLENYVLTICWIVGSWNFFDFFLGLGVLKDKELNQEFNLFNQGCKGFVTKIKKEIRKICQKLKAKKQKQK